MTESGPARRNAWQALSIRAAAADDLVALHALIEGAYRGESARRGWSHEADLLDGQRTDLKALQAILADPERHLLVAVEGDRPIACVMVERLAGGRGYMGMVTVKPALQARGLGRRLLEEAEAFARAIGISDLEMTVIVQREELIAWYERRGYRLTGERRPFPAQDPRFGLPRRDDLEFVVLAKRL